LSAGALLGIFIQTFKVTTRSKWLLMFTIVFFFFAFNLPFLSLQLLNLIPRNYISTFIQIIIAASFNLMPLLALPLGAVSIVEERESGSLQYVLSTPISRGRFLAARAAGLFAATTSIILLGFTLAALVAFRLSPGSISLWYVTVSACVLNASMIGISLVISVASRKRLTAHGIAIFIWFLFTYAGSTALAAPVLSAANEMWVLLPWIFLNPVEVSRLLAVMQLPSGVQDLGSTGMALSYVFGAGALVVLWVTMAMWISISLIAAFLVFTFQDIR
jgi:ABC-type transport system involved in multi-copper enzyme maturation permease subunit